MLRKAYDYGAIEKSQTFMRHKRFCEGQRWWPLGVIPNVLTSEMKCQEFHERYETDPGFCGQNDNRSRIIVFFGRKYVVHSGLWYKGKQSIKSFALKHSNDWTTRFDVSQERFATIGCCTMKTREAKPGSLFPSCWPKWMWKCCPSRRATPIRLQETGGGFEGLK